VIATTRSAPAAQEQSEGLAAQHPQRLVLTELEVGSEESISRWAAALKAKHNINHVDVRLSRGLGRSWWCRWGGGGFSAATHSNPAR